MLQLTYFVVAIVAMTIPGVEFTSSGSGSVFKRPLASHSGIIMASSTDAFKRCRR